MKDNKIIIKEIDIFRLMTTSNVFIIESLKLDDEKNERYEGKFLSHILNLDRNKKTSIYYYIRTKKELIEILKKFDTSNYRYLHISCHGNDKNVSMTLDKIPYEEFGEIVRPHLDKKRLFLSACEAVNLSMAKEIIPNSKCYSLIGFDQSIEFSDAAMMWASFYHLMFKKNPRAMKRKDICQILQKIKVTYGINMRFFSRSTKFPGGIQEDVTK
ncbi:MAG: hypothetical protein MUO82_12055 [Candidatus Thermoplasmatota archaeon]|nr:hypothetical protein [Candidatus Thermoplasmatota archaeon]